MRLFLKQSFNLRLERTTSGMLKGRIINILSSESPFVLRLIIGAGKRLLLVPEEK